MKDIMEHLAFTKTPAVMSGNSQSFKSGFKGWLVVFLFQMVAGSILSLVYLLCTYDVETRYGNNNWIYAGDLCFSILLMGLSLYILYLFLSYKPNAVFMAKAYTAICFSVNLLTMANGTWDADGLYSMLNLVRSMCWHSVWFIYLTFSVQVEEHFPKGVRKSKVYDHIILLITVGIPLCLLSVGISKAVSDKSIPQIDNTCLGKNEWTDGMMAFTCPDNLIVTKRTRHTEIYHELVDDSITPTSVTSVFCGYITESTLNKFTAYRDSCMFQTRYFANPTPMYDKSYLIDGRQCRLTTFRFGDKSDNFYWDFALVFDEKTHKVCFLACKYEDTLGSPVTELMNALRFE